MCWPSVRKLEHSQAEERELWKKSQAPDFGQSLGRVASKAGQMAQIGIPAEQPLNLPN